MAALQQFIGNLPECEGADFTAYLSNYTSCGDFGTNPSTTCNEGCKAAYSAVSAVGGGRAAAVPGRLGPRGSGKLLRALTGSV